MKKQFLFLISILSLYATPVFAEFNLNGSTITQSGTDTSLAGLSGISGVTVTTESRGFGLFKTIYTLSGRTLAYNDLTFDATREKLVFLENCPSKRMSPANASASLTINAIKTPMGNSIYMNEEAILFLRAERFSYDNAYDGSRGDFYINQGNFIWNGGIIRYSGAVEINVGTINNGSLISYGNGALADENDGDPSSVDLTTSGQMFFGGNLTINDLYVANGNYVIITNANVTINSITTEGMMRGLEVDINDFEIRNLNSINGVTELGGYKAKRGILINPLPDEIRVAGHVFQANNNAPNSGTLNDGAFKRIKESRFVNIRNGDGTLAEAIYYIKDYDNGNRKGFYFPVGLNDITATGSISSGNSLDFDVTVAITEDLVSPRDGTLWTWDYRSKNGDTTHVFDIYLLSYHNLIGELEQSFKGGGRQDIAFLFAEDFNITESNRVTVDGYATIDNLDQLYDRAKSWKVTTANIEYPTIGTQPVTADGTVLDLGNRNLLVDASAGSAFAINTGTNTITIKSTAALVKGTKFSSIKTSGTVSTANGASLKFGYENPIGTINKYVALSNLSNTDTVLITDNIANTTLVNVTGITGDYKAHFIAPADASDLEVSVTRPNFSTFLENYPENDMSFVREINLQITQVVAESQIEVFNLVLKILQKEEAMYRALDLTNPTLNVNITTGPNTGTPSVENQLAILDILNKIFVKVIANRRKL